jgi:hypothetical protein
MSYYYWLALKLLMSKNYIFFLSRKLQRTKTCSIKHHVNIKKLRYKKFQILSTLYSLFSSILPTLFLPHFHIVYLLKKIQQSIWKLKITGTLWVLCYMVLKKKKSGGGGTPQMWLRSLKWGDEHVSSKWALNVITSLLKRRRKREIWL